MVVCENCLHKPVCGKYAATGGQVRECKHLLEKKVGSWEEWYPPVHMILTGEEMLYRCSVCTAKYSDVEGYDYCPFCGAQMERVPF